MTDLPDLIPLATAQALVLDGLAPLDPVDLPLAGAAGLVLAAPVAAAVTVPPWANSSMDGFAVRAADTAQASAAAPVELAVLGEVAAGRAPDTAVAPGTAVRIMTGAPVPPDADAVVPVEDTDAEPGVSALPARVAVRIPASPGANIRAAGSDVTEGTHLLDPGRVVDAAVVALLASTGHGSVAVHRRPRMAVISTGDELAAPGSPLGPAQIYESNSYSLLAAGAEAGVEVRRIGVARDTLDALLEKVGEAVAWADVVVLSGGVSVGAHDHVKPALRAVGTLDVWRVALKPGRPFAFGRASVDGRPVLLFGLPGNPVSVFVTFELFVRPVLRRLAGHTGIFDRPELRVRLAEPMRGAPGRLTVARAVVTRDPAAAGGLVARASGGQESHMLFSLATANALLFIEPDTDLAAGDEATAWLLRSPEG